MGGAGLGDEEVSAFAGGALSAGGPVGDVAGVSGDEGKPRADAFVVPAQRELFRAMVAHNMTPLQILDLYNALFPDDKEWAQKPEIRNAIDSSP